MSQCQKVGFSSCFFQEGLKISEISIMRCSDFNDPVYVFHSHSSGTSRRGFWVAPLETMFSHVFTIPSGVQTWCAGKSPGLYPLIPSGKLT